MSGPAPAYQPPQPNIGFQPAPPPPGYNVPPPPQQTAVPNYGTYQPVATSSNTTNTNVVVVGQPQTAANVTLVHHKPDNYIPLSIFTLFCCCWLFGIIALIHGMQVDSAYASGDLVGAQIASRTARSWNVAAIVFGSITISVAIIANFIWIPIVVVASASDDY